MINLTAQYPNQVFLPVAATQLMAQINRINSTGIINKDFPKKIHRPNAGFAPDGLGAPISQIDALINSDPQYGFQSLHEARTYVLQAANQMVNNPCFYVETIPSPLTSYSIVVWGTI